MLRLNQFWRCLCLGVSLLCGHSMAGANWVGQVDATITAKPSGKIVQSANRAVHFSHEPAGWTMIVTDRPQAAVGVNPESGFTVLSDLLSSAVRRNGDEYQSIRLSNAGVTNVALYRSALALEEHGTISLVTWLSLCTADELTVQAFSNVITACLSPFNTIRLHAWKNEATERVIQADILSGPDSSVRSTFDFKSVSDDVIRCSLHFESTPGQPFHTTIATEGTFTRHPLSATERLAPILTNSMWHVADLRFLSVGCLFYTSGNDSFPRTNSIVTQAALSKAKQKKSQKEKPLYANSSWLIIVMLALLMPAAAFFIRQRQIHNNI